jgi:hypothetical protein
LKKSARIVHGDALEYDWNNLLNSPYFDVVARNTNVYVVEEPQQFYETVTIKTNNLEVQKLEQPNTPRKTFDYIIGNPPFIGSKIMTQTQRNQIVKQFDNSAGSGVLDYVSAWYIKAAKYIQGTKTKAAFVSTNSIVQGEQTSILWGQMLNKYNIKIHFAHRTFKWSNEAKGNAAVYCIIVGFANFDTPNKSIFEYDDIKGEAHEIKAKNINPYLVDAKDILITKRSTPICGVPKIKFGNQPIDGGWLILDEKEKEEAISKEPQIEKYIRRYFGSEEFINGRIRYCLWFTEQNFEPSEIKKSKFILQRLKNVRQFRLESERNDTRKLADSPSQFAFKSHEESEYIIIPSVSSERRRYIPIGFMTANEIASNLCLIIPNAKLYHFGILTSIMHMSWVKSVCGRLESRFRYSNSVVYNNFPWPEKPSEKQIKAIEAAAQKVLEAREKYPNSTMADLYEQNGTPTLISKAHNELDKAVDLAYRSQAFSSEANRMEFLFGLYEKYTADLFTKEKVKKGKVKKELKTEN